MRALSSCGSFLLGESLLSNLLGMISFVRLRMFLNNDGGEMLSIFCSCLLSSLKFIE